MATPDPIPPRDALILEHQLAQAGRLSGLVTHELNNQLAAISGYTELLSNKPEAAPFARQLERIAGAALRAQELITNYREAMLVSAEPEPVNIGLAVTAAIAARGFQFEKRSLSLTVDIASDLPTQILNAGHVQLALGALLDNAYEEMAPRAMGDCTVSARRLGEGGTVVEIVNMVEAPPPAPHLWQTTKDPLRHAGLGLAVATWVAEAAGGRCEVSSSTPGEMRVRWELPTGRR